METTLCRSCKKDNSTNKCKYIPDDPFTIISECSAYKTNIMYKPDVQDEIISIMSMHNRQDMIDAIVFVLDAEFEFKDRSPNKTPGDVQEIKQIKQNLVLLGQVDFEENHEMEE